MFLRLITDNFARRPRRKLLTAAALALGMGVATVALSVALDVGDRLAREFRSLGANLVVTPTADSLPLEIGGVDYRPVNAGAYLPEVDLPKLKTIFWHNNIMGFVPVLEVPIQAWTSVSQTALTPKINNEIILIGTWARHAVAIPDGGAFVTGVEKTNPWWQVEGRLFADGALECVVGRNFASKNHLRVGDFVHVNQRGQSAAVTLKVTGILSTGGVEDDAIVAPLSIVQLLAGKPGQYRKLYVSALTKPEDAFGKRDPKTMNAGEFERWSCSPYVSSIAYSI